jgi:hypothetical protein
MKFQSIFKLLSKILFLFSISHLIIKKNIMIAKNKIQKKKIIVFDISEDQFLDFLDPIIQDLKKKNYYRNIEIYFAVSNKVIKSKEKIENILVNLKTNKKKLIIIDYVFLLPLVDLFISAHFYSSASFFTKSVNIPRGVGKWFVAPKFFFSNFNIHFLTGPLHQEQVLDAIKIYKLKRKIEYFKIGFPKIDKVYNNEYSKKKIMDKYNLDKNKTTIVFSPSWDQGMLLSDFNTKLVEFILSNFNNFNLIVKLHPSSLVNINHPDYNLYTQGVDWRESFKKFYSYKNFAFVQETNANEVLSISDIMITDVSSIAYEYLILKKPIFFYDSPNFYDENVNSFYKDFQNSTDIIGNPRENPRINCGRHMGHIFKNIEDLKELLNQYIYDKTILDIKDKVFCDSLFYNIGKSKNFASHQIIEILKNNQDV